MENQVGDEFMFEKFTWTINHFSKLRSKSLYSETFVMDGHPWRIHIFPNGNNVDHLSLYLDVGDTAKFPSGWTRYAVFRLALYNQVNSNLTITKETQHHFNARENDWGFTSFIPLAELRDPCKGFLVKDTCIVAAELCVRKPKQENQMVEATSIVDSLKSDGQAGQMEVETSEPEDGGLDSLSPVSAGACAKPVEHANNPLPKEMSSDIDGELVDFMGLGKIEKAFVPLLQEVCSQHPSLIECQQKRSNRFIEWAFTALGRVLHFLKTKKVKDMNEDTCKWLQILWEELETFRFDLTWLEPHVQSALGMKNYVERAMQVKMLKDNVAAQELEVKRLEAKLAATEVDLDIARRDLLKAEGGFEERDLDAELDYGRP